MPLYKDPIGSTPLLMKDLGLPGPARPLAETLVLKTAGITESDVIRVLAVPGSGMFRDGMTVGEFLRGGRNRQNASEMMHRCRRLGTIGIVHCDPPPGDTQ